MDGTTFDAPDTPSDMEHFGRPGNSRGEGRSAYPQVRVAALAECGTHAIFAAAPGPLATHETTLARQLFPALSAGMLLLADRGFVSFDLWRTAAATGADLLWRARAHVTLPVIRPFDDGSYLSERSSPPATTTGGRIRSPCESRNTPSVPTRPSIDWVTTILNPELAPAAELAALYDDVGVDAAHYDGGVGNMDDRVAACVQCG